MTPPEIDQLPTTKERKLVCVRIATFAQPPMAPPKPSKPKVPLFFFYSRSSPTLNWRHWGAPLVVLLVVVTMPLWLTLFIVRKTDETFCITYRLRERRRKKEQLKAAQKAESGGTA